MALWDFRVIPFHNQKLPEGVEPSTCALPRRRATTALRQRFRRWILIRDLSLFPPPYSQRSG
jgi:hypothetical protein